MYITPIYADGHFYQGEVYLNADKDHKKAAESYEKSVKLLRLAKEPDEEKLQKNYKVLHDIGHM